MKSITLESLFSRRWLLEYQRLMSRRLKGFLLWLRLLWSEQRLRYCLVCVALVPVESWSFGMVFSHLPVLPGSGGSMGMPLVRGQPLDPARLFKLPELPEQVGLGSVLLPPDDDQEVEEYSREEMSPSVTILVRNSEPVWEQKRSEDRERLEAFKEEEVPVKDFDNGKRKCGI